MIANPAGLLQVVCPTDHADLSYSVVTTEGDLNLVDLTNAGQRRIGIDNNALVAGPRSTYANTRAWAEMIHRSCPDAQGLYYTSLQFGPEFAIILFGDRVPVNALSHIETVPVTDPTCHARIFDRATSLSIDYVDI